MAHLIDKDALVAEIDRRIGEIDKYYCDINCVYQRIEECKGFLSFIDTLEVKEDNLLTEKKNEKELAEIYINIFDKKFGNKLPQLKRKQLAEFKNFINTCEQTFHIKYFDYHATQGKLFEKLALLWAVWGKEHLNLEVKEVDLDFVKEVDAWVKDNGDTNGFFYVQDLAKHFFELGVAVGNKAQKGEKV